MTNTGIEKAITNAILENKLIEWQNYKNPKSDLYLNSIKYQENINMFIQEKFKTGEYSKILNSEILDDKINTVEWIEEPEIIILGNNKKDNIKTIKLLSRDLLNCIPNNKNIQSSANQSIIINSEIINNLDCIIV